MSEHTPGPWTVDRLCIQAPDGNVALVNLARASEADARLIAAAPDLLAALKKISDQDGGACGCEHDDEKCCAIVGEPCPRCVADGAIAKAEGR